MMDSFIKSKRDSSVAESLMVWVSSSAMNIAMALFSMLWLMRVGKKEICISFKVASCFVSRLSITAFMIVSGCKPEERIPEDLPRRELIQQDTKPDSRQK